MGNKDASKYNRTEASRIIQILNNLPNWRPYTGNEQHKKRITGFVDEKAKNYGLQRAYEKFVTPEEKQRKDREACNENMNKIFNTENENYFMEV